MLQFKKPRAPVDYAARARAAERLIRADIAAGRTPIFDDRIWKSYKKNFIAAQYGKCGYCEHPALNHPGAVEHYAPKSEIHELMNRGAEHRETANVLGRSTNVISDSGYWWLAYKWDNWLFTCERCNSGWKRCVFPVRERPRALPPARATRETPLLLHPFGRIDPTLHLTFSSIGQIGPRNHSDRGIATIDTCGLDRESLRRVREPIALDTNRHVDVLEQALVEDAYPRALNAVANLLSLAADHRPHAGMVRILLWNRLGCQLPALERLQKRLQAKLPRSASKPRPRRASVSRPRRRRAK